VDGRQHVGGQGWFPFDLDVFSASHLILEVIVGALESVHGLWFSKSPDVSNTHFEFRDINVTIRGFQLKQALSTRMNFCLNPI
jgi:hypothetical protein